MSRLLPDWLRNYPKQHLGSDVLAGIIVTILVIPQSLAYALLAGLPPQAGLYVSIFPVMAYAIFGSSMVQAVEKAIRETGYRPNAIARSLRAGHAFPSGIKIVADELPEPADIAEQILAHLRVAMVEMEALKRELGA